MSTSYGVSIVEKKANVDRREEENPVKKRKHVVSNRGTGSFGNSVTGLFHCVKQCGFHFVLVFVFTMTKAIFDVMKPGVLNGTAARLFGNLITGMGKANRVSFKGVKVVLL